MKKLFLSLIAVAVGTLSCFAQDDLVATLSHGSTLSTFTGVDALSQAYTAAEEGDIITLSPGEFTAINVEKGITIRGAGMASFAANDNSQPTRIVGSFIVIIPNDCTSTPSFEGLRFMNTIRFCGGLDAINASKKVNIIKCYFGNNVDCWNCSPTFINCILSYLNATMESGSWGSIYSSQHGNTNVVCVGCAIMQACSNPRHVVYPSFLANFYMRNCVAWLNCNGSGMSESTFENCILEPFKEYNPIPASSTYNNCIFTGEAEKLVNVPAANNIIVEGGPTSIFKTVTSRYVSSKETFELTETAAATYLGDDGTQVGIYGGTNPFNPTPTNPQVKKFTVSSTTQGDQLKVKINVE